jgi:hypothetical protein
MLPPPATVGVAVAVLVGVAVAPAVGVLVGVAVGPVVGVLVGVAVLVGVRVGVAVGPAPLLMTIRSMSGARSEACQILIVFVPACSATARLFEPTDSQLAVLGKLAVCAALPLTVISALRAASLV